MRCKANRRRVSDRTRGGPRDRGYGGDWEGARRTVLIRDSMCMCVSERCEHVRLRCGRASVVADHYPKSRRDLVRSGVQDANDPLHMRGMCKECHDMHTAKTSPGGWNRK